jgi:parvulin-like peptidyl-prolyl isomerase
MAVIAVAVVLIIAYGIYDSVFVQPNQTVATVDAIVISSGDFKKRVRWEQRNLVGRLNSNVQLLSLFADQPDLLADIESQIRQTQTQLSNPQLLGPGVIDELISEVIFEREAALRGIVVSPEEIDETFYSLFGFYPEGTPTPDPDITAVPTRTPEEGIPTPTLQPTATAYTREAYDKDYKELVKSLGDFDLDEAFLRDLIRKQRLQVKLRESFESEIELPIEKEQVLLRHILLEDEETANEVAALLESGSPWDEIAAQYSKDLSTADSQGELGWLSEAEILRMFGPAALSVFGLPLEEASQPIQTSMGWHLFLVSNREIRDVSESQLPTAIQELFDAWVDELHQQAEITIEEDWQKYLPKGIG